MLLTYGKFGGIHEKISKGGRYGFSHNDGHTGTIDLYGNLSGFFVSDVDFTYGKDMIFRAQLEEKYIGIGILEDGTSVTYKVKSNPRILNQHINFYVDIARKPFFMRIQGGKRLKFFGIYFLESFFTKNNIDLYDSFWFDAEQVLNNSTYKFPEITMIARQIKNCTLEGEEFNMWLKGQGYIIFAHILNHIKHYAKHKPVFLHNDEKQAIARAKEILHKEMVEPPSVIELAKKVGINKNKLQSGFRFTEGKSAAEYLRCIRMERALELLEENNLSINEISMAIGYRCKGNFYAAFNKTFGDTPANIQKLLCNCKNKYDA
jgi:AraC-like DNA-binding protein